MWWRQNLEIFACLNDTSGAVLMKKIMKLFSVVNSVNLFSRSGFMSKNGR